MDKNSTVMHNTVKDISYQVVCFFLILNFAEIPCNIAVLVNTKKELKINNISLRNSSFLL